MFGLKQRRNPQPKEFGPLFAIADLMAGLTYTDMMAMAREVQRLTEEHGDMHTVLHQWAVNKAKQSGFIRMSDIIDSTITATKLQPRTLQPGEKLEEDPAASDIAQAAVDAARVRVSDSGPGFGAQRRTPPPPTLSATTDDQLKARGA